MELALLPPSPASLRCESDEDLVELGRLGDEAAFAELSERHRPALLAHCRRLVGPTGAEDAVQQAFMSAWDALLRGCEVRSPRAWLFTIARRAALQLAREESCPEELPDSLAGGCSAEEQHEATESVRRALRAVARLPEREREALVATSIHGRSGQATARALGVSEEVVRQLVFRARCRARAAMGALLPPLPLEGLARLASAGHHAATRVLRARSAAAAGPGSPSLAPLAAMIATGALAGIPVIALEHHAGTRAGGGQAPSQPAAVVHSPRPAPHLKTSARPPEGLRPGPQPLARPGAKKAGAMSRSQLPHSSTAAPDAIAAGPRTMPSETSRRAPTSGGPDAVLPARPPLPSTATPAAPVGPATEAAHSLAGAAIGTVKALVPTVRQTVGEVGSQVQAAGSDLTPAVQALDSVTHVVDQAAGGVESALPAPLGALGR